MKRTLLFTIIIILYLLTPVCIMSALGTMVSKKYDIDERYWQIDGNDKLTPKQKAEQIQNLDSKGRQFEYWASTFAFLSFATFITATVLVIKRNKIVTKSGKQHIPRAL